MPQAHQSSPQLASNPAGQQTAFERNKRLGQLTARPPLPFIPVLAPQTCLTLVDFRKTKLNHLCQFPIATLLQPQELQQPQELLLLGISKAKLLL